MSDEKDPDWTQLASEVDAPPAGSWHADTEWSRLSAQLITPVSHPRTAWHRTLAPWLAGTLTLVVLGSLVLGLRWHMASQAWTYATVAGQRLSVTLPDGTRAMLAPASRLRVTNDRTVDLEGEAEFSVVHNQRHPFAVRANNVKISDVGTEFDVRAYDARVRVAVREGEIVVGEGRAGQPEPRFARLGLRPAPTTTNDTTYLTAGDMAEATDTGFVVMHHADIAAAMIWQQGGLSFHDTPLREAIPDLARTFDLEISVTDSTLLNQRITGSFQGSVVDNVLTAVTIALGAQYDRTGSKVVIHRPSSSSTRQTPPTERPNSLTTVLYP